MNSIALRITSNLSTAGYRLASNMSQQQYIGYKSRTGVMRIKRIDI
jgi:hypothetical protein